MNIRRRARGVNILLASGTPSVLPARDAAGQIPVVLPQLGPPDSERFRANPRTCGRFPGILSLR
jgi:hypothetical protein